jgi:hypothetical protein
VAVQTIADILESTRCEAGEWQLALQEFHLAANMGNWKRAEDARQKAIAHMEAQLDSFIRAYRLSRESG